MILGLEFPPISHLIEWPDIFWKGTAFAVNKVVLIMWASALLAIALFVAGSRKRALVPTGVQNVAESIVDFVDSSIVMQTMGPEGRKFTPFLTCLFMFILFCNLWEVIPFVQMPANARMAMPMFFSLLVWVIFNAVGIIKQGFFHYFKSIMFPPGVPWPIYILVTPIELVSTILVRPLSLAVRLFANMLAGHLVLVTFAVISAALWVKSINIVILPFSFLLLVALTGFEVLVSFLQAFIFTILAAVYIGGAMHPEH
ncbi:MAG TPA: F0F1 ATP synthase subunit A [Acidimicrobiales bacterium]|nr:F0F1 ATP synthase subunit A [Acidimicrobiales bacterium]